MSQMKWRSVGKHCPYYASQEEIKFQQLWTLLKYVPLTKQEIIEALNEPFTCTDEEAGKQTRALFNKMIVELDQLLESGVESGNFIQSL